MIEYIHSRLYLVLVKVMVERQPFPAPKLSFSASFSHSLYSMWKRWTCKLPFSSYFWVSRGDFRFRNNLQIIL